MAFTHQDNTTFRIARCLIRNSFFRLIPGRQLTIFYTLLRREGGFMKESRSFSSLGHLSQHAMRKAINGSKDIVELGNQFSYVAANFLRKAFEDTGLAIRQNDISFSVSPAAHFVVNPRLEEIPSFCERWYSSDMSLILKKFADSAFRRYLHLARHEEKTRLKIR